MTFSNDFDACIRKGALPAFKPSPARGSDALVVLDRIHAAWTAAGGNSSLTIDRLTGLEPSIHLDEQIPVPAGSTPVATYSQAITDCLIDIGGDAIWDWLSDAPISSSVSDQVIARAELRGRLRPAGGKEGTGKGPTSSGMTDLGPSLDFGGEVHEWRTETDESTTSSASSAGKKGN